MFLFLAPGTVDVLVPWWIMGWRGESGVALRIAGALLSVAGLFVLVESFLRFALRGLGTPAPVFPTQHLVVSGYYRYVRNPMYVANLAIVLGQSLWFASVAVAIYAAALWAGFHVFVMLYEERNLRSTFGVEYEAFCRRVPRWIPRLTPWTG